jgi:hypothetical protein
MTPPSSIPTTPNPTFAPVTPVMTNPNPNTEDNSDVQKEWVVNLKHIIKQTAGDPYQQSLQIANLKAGFLQKQHNIFLKTD